MRVRLKLLTTYRSLLPTEAPVAGLEVEVPTGTHVDELLVRFGVPVEEPHVVFVNGRHAEPDQVLREGDVVAAFPAMAGG